MIACRLGCDALFEAGYIGVDDAGFVVGSSVGVASELAAVLEGIVGRRCSAWRRETAGYFAWHNQNTLRG